MSMPSSRRCGEWALNLVWERAAAASSSSSSELQLRLFLEPRWTPAEARLGSGGSTKPWRWPLALLMFIEPLNAEVQGSTVKIIPRSVLSRIISEDTRQNGVCPLSGRATLAGIKRVALACFTHRSHRREAQGQPAAMLKAKLATPGRLC